MSSEVADSYLSSLSDLKMSSRPQISMLTMLAEDHEQYAADIVRVIEEQIKKIFYFYLQHWMATGHPSLKVKVELAGGFVF
ncbi:pre-mrna cleavage complex 2 protein pcf11 [Elysia marginata]|uniref:Pre-mrna cleavage complex 2 protein pcf11 n=1 Tax=Elysia marginata TaxID=1093978 RepID=A0AAV4IQP1_9GAST|nr:pre-mrna cleavage complex 2 protein pcf11 [Elysia marginata]